MRQRAPKVCDGGREGGIRQQALRHWGRKEMFSDSQAIRRQQVVFTAGVNVIFICHKLLCGKGLRDCIGGVNNPVNTPVNRGQ
jgi:hypothetical protein